MTISINPQLLTSPKNAHYMSQNYRIIWKHFDKASSIGKHLVAKENFSLPYFLTDEDLKMFEKKENVNLNSIHLVKGLLVGYFDKPEEVDTNFAKAIAKTIILEQIVTFKAATLENLILDLSAFLRDSYGQIVSLQALMAGIELLPESSAIKYDCCIDLINCIDDNELDDKISAIQKLKLILTSIELNSLNPDLLEDYREMIKISNELN